MVIVVVDDVINVIVFRVVIGRVCRDISYCVGNFELVIVDFVDINGVDYLVFVICDVDEDDFKNVVDVVGDFDEDFVVCLENIGDDVVVVWEFIRGFGGKSFCFSYVVVENVDDGIVSVSFGIFDMLGFRVVFKIFFRIFVVWMGNEVLYWVVWYFSFICL